MRRLVLVALVLPLLAGCAFSPFSSGSSFPAPVRVYRGCTVLTPQGSQPCHSRRIPVRLYRVRRCGLLAVGSGWRVSTRSLSCRAGMGFMRAFFHGGADQAMFRGYDCGSGTALRIVCTRPGPTRVVAVANR